MKVQTLTLVAAFLLAGFSLSAQEDEAKETIRYSNVTEFGFTTASPRGISLEATTAHGISIEKQHCFGLGTGIGVNFLNRNSYNYTNRTTVYMPVFFNYRLYFKPEKTFSPHVNIAVGGLVLEEGTGIYSSIAMGFKAGSFSFSSGLSFMPFCTDEWYYPFGMTLKVGFSF